MAANNFTGVVEKVHKNDAGYWSILMADGQWFGHGKMKPSCTDGDEIAFDYSQNGKYNNADPDTLEILSSDNAVPKKASKPAWNGKKNASSEGKDEYWKNKEARDILTQNEIRFQAGRNAAIEIVTLAVSHGLLTIPQGKKEGDQFKVLLTYVDKVTDRYVEATKAVNAPVVEKPKAAPKPAPKVVEEEPEVEQELNDDISFI
jgi:hypothetical protein